MQEYVEKNNLFNYSQLNIMVAMIVVSKKVKKPMIG